jgi:hypothetical protein
VAGGTGLLRAFDHSFFIPLRPSRSRSARKRPLPRIFRVSPAESATGAGVCTQFCLHGLVRRRGGRSGVGPSDPPGGPQHVPGHTSHLRRPSGSRTRRSEGLSMPKPNGWGLANIPCASP